MEDKLVMLCYAVAVKSRGPAQMGHFDYITAVFPAQHVLFLHAVGRCRQWKVHRPWKVRKVQWKQWKQWKW